jgi:hypothetical protein
MDSPGGHVGVQWEQVPQHVYDDLVSTLLSREHPNAERIDGSGGDGGRDVQVREAGRLDIFELKSFTGRVSARSPSRRRQVEKSLARAALHNPDSWSLVVPIDHNPDELAWFDLLRDKYSFPLSWKGKTWLDGRMASYPELVRFFLHNGNDKVVELLRELGREEAALAGGAPDALERFQGLSKRLDEVSPHYRLDLAREGDEYKVTIVPRYRGAEQDRPILLHGRFKFPDTEAGREARDRVAEFFKYGGEVEIGEEHLDHFEVDAPAGLGGMFTGGRLKLSSIPDTAGLPLDARLIVLDPGDKPLASLPARFDHRILGDDGGILTGHDLTGGLHLRIRFDAADRRAKLNITLLPSAFGAALPASVLPVCQFAAKMRAPNRFQVRFGHVDFGPAMTLPDREAIPEGDLALIEDLALIQARTSTPFPIPDDLRRQDLWMVHRIARLLEGERITLGQEPLELTLTVTSPDVLAGLLAFQDGTTLAYMIDSTVEIAGLTVPLGPATIYVPSATLGCP